MASARITESGEILIPKDIIETLHLHAGDSVDIEVENDRVVRIYAKTVPPSKVCGMLGSKTRVKSSVAEMDEAVSEAFKNSEL